MSTTSGMQTIQPYILADDEKDLKILIAKVQVQEESLKAGLSLNMKKTKVTSTGPLENFKLSEETIEIVDRFIFLGTKGERERTGCAAEIKRRIVLGKTAMSGLHKIMKDKDVSKQQNWG